MINSGEVFMANEFIHKLNVNKKIFGIKESDIIAEKKKKKELCYQLDLNSRNVHFINNKKKVKRLKQIVSEKHKFIGLDAEYLSSKFGILKKRASLLQVKFKIEVYLKLNIRENIVKYDKCHICH